VRTSEPSTSTVYAATNFVREALSAGARFGYLLERDAFAAGLDRGHTAAAKRSLGVVVEIVTDDEWRRAIWRLPNAADRAKVAAELPASGPRGDYRPRSHRLGNSNRIAVELGTDNHAAALDRALDDFAPVLMAAKVESRRRVAFVPPSAARKAKSLKANQRRRRGATKAARRNVGQVGARD
jgi:hypothetical protein